MFSRPRRHASIALLAIGLPCLGGALASPAAASTTGNEVVFALTDSGSGSTYVVSRTIGSGSNLTLLKDPNIDYYQPERAADGSGLVAAYDDFSATDEVQGIVYRATASSTITRLTSTVNVLPQDPTTTPYTLTLDEAPTLSPDGTRVVFTREVDDITPTSVSATYNLYEVPVAGGITKAVPGGADLAAGNFDPTGTKIVTATTATTQPELTVLDAGTGARTDLHVIGHDGAFSPDGSTIAYSTQTGGATTTTYADDLVQIATIPATGGTQRILAKTRPTAGISQAYSPSWLPDGHSLTFTLSDLDAVGDPINNRLWAVDSLGTRSGLLVGSDLADSGKVEGPPPVPVEKGAGSTFVPVTPTRLLDTRYGTGAPKALVGAGQSIPLQITGRAGVPSNATAVVLNVTALHNSGGTNIRVYPTPATGSAVPTVSNVNLTAPNQVVPNLVTTSIGNNGQVSLFNTYGTTDLFADIAGYYVPSGGVKFQPLDPKRIMDSRYGTGVAKGAFGPGAIRDLQVAGVNGVPRTATAVVLNVTGTAPSTGTNVRVYPSGAGVPNASNLNLAKNQTAANLVTVKITPSNGKIRFYNATGTVQLLADIAGYYDAAAPGVYVPVAPVRFLDTRSGIGAVPLALGAGQSLDLQIGGDRGVPADVLAALLTITGTGTTASTYVSAYPATASLAPNASNLNLVAKDTRANAAIVKPGAATGAVGRKGAVRMLNSAGTLNLISDISGYFVAG